MLNPENQLEQLFYPVSPQDFFARYWAKKPLLIRGAASKYEPLEFSTKELYKIGRSPAESQVAKAWVDMKREIAIDPRSIQRHYNAGRSICINDIQMRNGPMRAIVAALKSVLGLAHEIGFAACISPTRQGIPLHVDRHDVFILQLEGEKEWRYARSSSVEFPLTATQPANPATIDRFVALHGLDTSRVPRKRDLLRAVLRPGDLLYLPGGTFHATFAPKHSLSLTLGCTPRPMWSIIGKTIERAFRDQREWRRNPPAIRAAEAGSARAVEQLLRSRIRDLSHWLANVDI